MNISRLQTDKIIVGTNDVSYTAPDTSPTGTTVLNGPVYVGKPTASPGYDAVFNVGTPPPPQQPFDTQPPLSASLGIKLDGSMEIVGDGRVPNALKISGGQLNKLFVEISLIVVSEKIIKNKPTKKVRYFNFENFSLSLEVRIKI